MDILFFIIQCMAQTPTRKPFPKYTINQQSGVFSGKTTHWSIFIMHIHGINFIDGTSIPSMHGLLNVRWRCLDHHHVSRCNNACELSVHWFENSQSMGVETSALLRKQCLLCCFPFPHL